MASSIFFRTSLAAIMALVSFANSNPVSYAQVTGGERTTMSLIDQAIRTGDFGRAAALLQKPAESGNSEAQYRLGSLYRSGRGVSQDEALAFKWMKAAAERNHANAQFNLAKMYLAGRGAAPDANQAKSWLQKAASHGNDEAAKLLAELSTRRTIESGASNSTPSPVPPGTRNAGKVEILPQRGPPAARQADRAEILDAAWRGQTDVVKKLIASGVGIAATDDDGNTALSLAALSGKLQTVDTDYRVSR